MWKHRLLATVCGVVGPMLVAACATSTEPAHSAGTASSDSEEGGKPGSASPVELAPSFDARLVSADPAPGEGFGHTVDVDGDTVVVGIPGRARTVRLRDELQRRPGAGATAIYERETDGAWRRAATFEGARRRNGFGGSVAIDGDRIVVGVPGEGSPADGVGGFDDRAAFGRGAPPEKFDSGAAYVLRREDSGGWSREVYLKAAEPRARDRFGASVDIDGKTAVVGVPRPAATYRSDSDEYEARGTGAVVVFRRVDDEWRQTARLSPSDVEPGDMFGTDVSIAGDRLAVGASSAAIRPTLTQDDAREDVDEVARDGGEVRLFLRDSTGDWREGVRLTSSNADRGDRFGTSVALESTGLAVGAPRENDALPGMGDPKGHIGRFSGAAYRFQRTDGDQWQQYGALVAPNSEDEDYLGADVDVGGTVTIVGAPAEDVSGEDAKMVQDAGAAHLFVASRRRERGWVGRLRAPEPRAGGKFGAAVELSDDWMAVGAPKDQVRSTSEAGAVYMYERSETTR